MPDEPGHIETEEERTQAVQNRDLFNSILTKYGVAPDSITTPTPVSTTTPTPVPTTTPTPVPTLTPTTNQATQNRDLFNSILAKYGVVPTSVAREEPSPQPTVVRDEGQIPPAPSPVPPGARRELPPFGSLAEMYAAQGGPPTQPMSRLPAPGDVGAGRVALAVPQFVLETLGAVVEPFHRNVARPWAEGMVGMLDLNSFMPVIGGPPGMTVREQKLAAEIAEFEKAMGRKPSWSEFADVTTAAIHTPPGVRGALEAVPFAVIPGGAQSQALLRGTAARLGSRGLGGRVAGGALETAASGLTPLAAMERGIGAVAGFGLRAAGAGLRAVGASIGRGVGRGAGRTAVGEVPTGVTPGAGAAPSPRGVAPATGVAKEPWAMTRAEFRQPPSVGRQAVTNEYIRTRTGAKTSQELLSYYQNKYPELKGVTIGGLQSTKASGPLVNDGATRLVFDGGKFNPSSTQIHLTKDADLVVTRHEIEHLLDAIHDVIYRVDAGALTTGPRGGRAPSVFGRYDHAEFNASDYLHRSLVRDAISEGKLVPDEVLRDYPELATQAPTRVAPRTTAEEIAGVPVARLEQEFDAVLAKVNAAEAEFERLRGQANTVRAAAEARLKAEGRRNQFGAIESPNFNNSPEYAEALRSMDAAERAMDREVVKLNLLRERRAAAGVTPDVPVAPGARVAGESRAWDVDDWNKFILAEEERLVRMPDAPKPYEGPALPILHKLVRGTGRGEKTALNEQEQSLLRQFIDKEGIDSEFLGLTSRIWTNEDEVILGIIPRKLFGAGWKGHEYITWAPAKNTFAIHSTRPDPREVMRAGGTFQFGPRAITGAGAAPSPTGGMPGRIGVEVAEEVADVPVAARARATVDYGDSVRKAEFSSDKHPRGASYATNDQQIADILASDREFITVWHGTTRGGAEEILRTGEIRGYEAFGPGVTLAPNRAVKYSGGKFSVIREGMPGARPDRERVVLEFEIPREQFRYFEGEWGGQGSDELLLDLGKTRAAGLPSSITIDPKTVRYVTDDAGEYFREGLLVNPTDVTPGRIGAEVAEEVAEGGLPPTQPPVRPIGEGAGAGVPPSGRITTGFPELDNSLAQARETVAQDAPGRISRLIDRIPLIGRIRRWERPALDLPENIHVAHVGQGIAEGKFSTQAFSAENRFLRSVDDAFGPGASTGAKVDVPFIGNPSEISRPIHQTVLDIAQRPHLYRLTDAQAAVFTAGRQMDDDLLRLVNEGYGIERNQFPAPEGGMHWPNVDVSENALVVFEGNVVSAARTGRGRTRIFDTAAERIASDKKFVPETNLRILLRANNDSKARAIGSQTFKLGSGGKTRIEVIDEVLPGLRQARNDLTQELTNLRARIQTSIRQIGREGARTRRLERRLKATESRAASILERSENLADDFGPALATIARRIKVLLREAQSLDDAILVSTQRGAAAGAKQKTLLTELNELAPRLDRLRARYEAANLRGNVLVQEGLFRYFPAEEARLVENLLQVSNNKFLQFTENWRNTAFNADLSPLAGIQAPNAFFIDPDGTTLQLMRGLAQVRSPSDLLRGFRASALADDIAKDPASWQRFAAGTGRPITSGTLPEFAGGLLNRIPGFTTANQSMFTLLTRMQKRQFDDMVLSLTKGGIPENEAIAVAGDLVNKVFPMVNRRLLGQSSARATLLRSTLTSVSFIRQPAALMADAARGMVKVGLRQDVTPKERIAMRLMLKMAITIEGIAIMSNQLSAKMRGQDSARALKDSLDPTSGKFMSLVFPSGSSIGLGGPFRSLIKAIVPRAVKGLPIPLPFMGLGNWATSRAGPFFRTQYDLIRNEDFEGNKIITGDFPVNILQAILFEIEGGTPLTAGSGLEGIRTGKPIGDITREIFSQFMGQNFREETPFQERHAEVVRWAESMGILGPEGREVESYFDLTKAERIEFGNQFPELGEDVVRETERRAAGGQPWARYQVRIEEIETERIKGLTALGLLEVGKRDPQTGTRLERGDLDGAYRSIQSEAYTRKNEAAHNFEIEFEDKEEPTPEEAALQEYYDLGDKSEVNGVFIGRLWANNYDAFEKKLQFAATPRLLEFVRANTNLGPFPEGLLDKDKGLLSRGTLARIDNSIKARAKIKSRRKNK
jgi:hypothetical protein